MAPTKLISTSIGFQDAKGNVVANGLLSLKLSQNAEITAGGGQVTSEQVYFPLDANGKITTGAIYFGDELTPAGTTYRAVLYASNGCRIIQDFGFWSITGPSADLSTMVPASAGIFFAGGVLLSPLGSQTIDKGDLTLTTGSFVETANAVTGTGGLVRKTSPTLVTPNIGVATATTVNKVTFTAPATGATLALVDGTTVTGPASSDTIVGRATTDILTNKSLGGTGSTTPNTPFNRLKATRGSALVAGDFSIGAGWGSTASIAAVSGTDAAGSITILTGGSGIAANPSITLTFHDGTWTNPPIVVVSRGDVQTAGHVAAVTISATQVVFIVNTTANSGQNYPIYFVCIGT